ncbi:MAG: hypothetical protein AAFP04_14430 [Myxococcota bacterium]
MRERSSRIRAACLWGLMLAAAACSDTDVGTECPIDDLNAATEDTPGSNPEVVEVNTLFPCESLTCVSTDGRSGYCSRECRSDANCPSAFTCAQVVSIGPFSDREYCVWRRCQVDFECGDVETYACRDEPGSTLGRCDFSQ